MSTPEIKDASTPRAQWAASGEPDPHGSRYDCERAALCMGKLTDDELANGVFMHGDGTHGRPRIEDILAGRAHSPIAWLTAAKDRIRWLSRALAACEVLAGARPTDEKAPESAVDSLLVESHQRLAAALSALIAEQNDAPLERRRPQWQAAMDAARAALAAIPEELKS